MSAIIEFFKNLFRRLKKPPAPKPPQNLPEPEQEASNHPGRTDVTIEYRDNGGIAGACKRAKKKEPSHIIEGHFNSYNGKAHGYLCLSDKASEDFGLMFNAHMREYFPDRYDRKVDTDPARGGNNIRQCSGDRHKNILIEPFFGDNPADCITVEHMTEIMVSFIRKLKGPVVLIVGHTESSKGAYSKHLRLAEYDYWTIVFNKVVEKLKEEGIEEEAETKPVESKPIQKGWHKEYEDLIEKELKTGKYPNLLKYKDDIHYWKKFFHALSKAESNDNPFSTYWESNLGDPKGYDRVTKMKYMSEGLLQLSYSDAVYYKCDFDIEGDRPKDMDDETKTIFIPCRNIKCGLVILNKLVGRKGTPFFNTGHYWAVLKTRNSRHKVFLKYLERYLKED